MENNKVSSFLSRLKENAKKQEDYGFTLENNDAQINIRNCPGCGAGRAKKDGVTKCAYCEYKFLSIKLTDGLYIKKEDNSI